MPWTNVATYTDPETDITVTKQHRRRGGGRNSTRYLVKITDDSYIYMSRTQLFRMADTLDEICFKIEGNEF